jgi:hypothetical protein
VTGLAIDDLAHRIDVDTDVLLVLLDGEVEAGRVAVDDDGGYVIVATAFDGRVLAALQTIDRHGVSVERKAST